MAIISPENLPELCRSLKEGDEAALKRFFNLMQPNIFYYLYRFTGIREVAEDLTQESFINFWLSRDNLDPDKSCVMYLYRISRNLALNHINRTVRLSSLNDGDTALASMKGTKYESTEVFLVDDYQKAINTLPARCKETFLLSRFADLSYSEIAAIMGVSLQTVKNQLNKALSVLQKRLKHYHQ